MDEDEHDWSIWHREDPWPQRALRYGEQTRNCTMIEIHGCKRREYRHPVKVTANGIEWSEPTK